MAPRVAEADSAFRRRAFSRADLLVLIGLLCFLATVLLQVSKVRKQRAGEEHCRANLKVINGAVLLYAEDYQKTFPAMAPDRSTGVWWWYKELVKKYVHGSVSSIADSLFACPADRGYADPGPFFRNAKFDYGSYVFNGVNLPGVPNLAGVQATAVQEPYITLLMMEWSAHAPLSWHRSRTGRKNFPFYQDAENLVGFVDGHSARVKIYYDGINPAFSRDPIPGYHYRFSAQTSFLAP